LAIGCDINSIRKFQDQFCSQALVFALFRDDPKCWPETVFCT